MLALQLESEHHVRSENKKSYLVVWNDNHDDAWLHGNDLLKGLDVGRGPVVRDGDDLGFAELHAQGPGNLGH